MGWEQRMFSRRDRAVNMQQAAARTRGRKRKLMKGGPRANQEGNSPSSSTERRVLLTAIQRRIFWINFLIPRPSYEIVRAGSTVDLLRRSSSPYNSVHALRHSSGLTIRGPFECDTHAMIGTTLCRDDVQTIDGVGTAAAAATLGSARLDWTAAGRTTFSEHKECDRFRQPLCPAPPPNVPWNLTPLSREQND